jgi:hypothetical protein
MRFIADAAPEAGLLVDLDDQVEVVLLGRPLAKLQHFGKLVGGIDMQDGEGDSPGERLLGKPDQDVGVFAHRPGHAQVPEGVIRLAEDVDALALQLV